MRTAGSERPVDPNGSTSRNGAGRDHHGRDAGHIRLGARSVRIRLEQL